MSRLRSFLACVLVVVLAGCYVTKRTTLAPGIVPVIGKQNIVGVTTRDGKVLSFDGPAVLNGTTLHYRSHNELLAMPAADVQRYWVEFRGISKGRTALLVAGIAAGAAGVGLLIADLVGSLSGGINLMGGGGWCLFVYSWDGTQYTFDTEAYPAAITRGLERDDYSLLAHLREQNGQYRLLLSNDMDETQYTNLVELWVVDHRPFVTVRAGAAGRLYTIADPRPPLSARDSGGTDLLPWLRATDRLIWEAEPHREVVLTFEKPLAAREVKLVASTQISMLAGAMAAPAELSGLMVEVEEPEGWQVRGVLPIAGPFVNDERVTPLDISRVSGDRLRIRLRPAAFWALNSFAVDFSSEEPLPVTRVAADQALDDQGRDVGPLLTNIDDRYYEMTARGEKATVTFHAPRAIPGAGRTVFLHSRGYYNTHVPETGNPPSQ